MEQTAYTREQIEAMQNVDIRTVDQQNFFAKHSGHCRGVMLT